MATKQKPNKAEAMKATTPAQFAKAIGHTDGGKRLRARLRNMGVRVSDGQKFDRSHKDKLWAIFVEGKQVAKTKKQTSGGNSKQRRTARRKAEATPQAPAAEATATE